MPRLIKQLASYDGLPLTYAGGVGTFDDLTKLKQLGKSHINVTIGSALELFGGCMKIKDILTYIKQP